MIPRGALFALVTAALPCTACGADHMQHGDVAALGWSIDSARLEVSRHEDAITRATSLTAVPPEVDLHDHNMGDIMGTMSMRMDGMMSHCSGYGMAVMHDRMTAVTSEMQTHHEAMLSASTLQEARDVCSVHTSRMDGMFDDMQHSLTNVGCMGR